MCGRLKDLYRLLFSIHFSLEFVPFTPSFFLAPCPIPSPPLLLICLPLSLLQQPLTQFKVTSSHRLLGSPSLLTYFLLATTLQRTYKNPHTLRPIQSCTNTISEIQNNCIHNIHPATLIHTPTIFLLLSEAQKLSHTAMQLASDASMRLKHKHNFIIWWLQVVHSVVLFPTCSLVCLDLHVYYRCMCCIQYIKLYMQIELMQTWSCKQAKYIHEHAGVINVMLFLFSI